MTYQFANGLAAAVDDIIDYGYDVNNNPVYEIMSANTKLEIIRDMRDGLLEDSDWIMVSDSPFSDSKKAEWQTYRQALRDLPQSNTNPFSIVFPTRPS
jgi:hypothetical protein